MSRYIGLISGTSADALDAVLIDYSATQDTAPRALAHRQYSWPAHWSERIIRLQAEARGSLAELAALDHEYARVGVRLVHALLDDAGLGPSDVRAIGSHGQTVWHRADGDSPNSLQLGDPSRLAVLSGIPVVADLRRADMARGGQGAPMVPAFHAALWQSPDEQRIVINLGGIANVTILGSDGSIRGWDTGPANGLMDAWCLEHLGEPFDAGGAWAAGGEPDEELLATLLDEPYFRQPPPKSTGKDLFNAEFLARALQQRPGLSPRDVQRSLLELSARTVADALLSCDPQARVIVAGGGNRNEALMTRLRELLSPRQVQGSEDWGWPGQWIEAAAFAWLAAQRLEARSGNVPGVTGASAPAVLGGLYLP